MIRQIFANRSNAGDWLSAKGIRGLLPAGVPVTEHLCDEPFVPETLAALAAAGPDDFVVIGGGGLFMDYFTPFLAGFLPLADRLPFALFGVGFVDLEREASRPPLDLVRELAAKAAFCRVRDELTRALLAPLVLPPTVPCPSFAALPERPPAGRGVLHAANLTTVGQEAYDLMRSRAEEFAAGTGRVFRETNNRHRPDSEADLAAVLSLYERSDAILSSRLHGCIFAVAMGRKILAVSGDAKVDSFMASAGLSDWVLGLDELDEIPRRLRSLDGQPDPAQFRVEARRKLRDAARDLAAAMERR